jgi:hypothetical protein
MKLIICGGVTAAIFLLAALLPLGFRGGDTGNETSLSAGERVSIFSAYWNGGGENCTVENLSKLSSTEQDYCTARMSEVTARCLIDTANGLISSQGEEYLKIENNTGAIRLCRMWLELQGDWRSWIDMCFDMDSGEIYYFYLSTECVSTPEKYSKYSSILSDELDTEYVAEYIAAERDIRLLHTDWDGDPAHSASAIYTVSGSTVYMEISCIYYDALLDIKFCCV